jgi:hypothetical protein
MEWIIVPITRIALLVLWLTTPLVNHTFQGNWWIPLLGVCFLPLTVITYVLVATLAGSVSDWNWLWVAGGLLVDLGVNSYPARRGKKDRKFTAVV